MRPNDATRARFVRSGVEQASLRIRLAATALATTLLMLVPGVDRVAAGSLLLGYAAALLALWKLGPALRWSGAVGVVVDVLFATGLSLVIPGGEAWVIFLVPIATATLRSGILGLTAAVAGSVVAYDLVLILRGSSALATDLWRIQGLLAFGVLAAELVWVSGRARREQRALRAYSLAQRDVAAAADEAALLDRLVDHAVRGFGARAARIERDRPGIPPGPSRGDVHAADGSHCAIDLSKDTKLHAVFAEEELARGEAALRDLAQDARPSLEAARDRARNEQERAAEAQVLGALSRLGRGTTTAAVIAEGIAAAQAIGGPSAVVRLATGESLAGDLEAETAVAIARDAVAPALLRDLALGSRDASTAVLAPVARGLVLVCLGTRRELTGPDLQLLTRLGQAVGAAMERIEEREALLTSEAELRRASEDLERQLRARDDAVASAVHELRNPLTSVRGYGQLMSRHLATVQQQVSQLDALIGDLLQSAAGSAKRPLILEPTDLGRETAAAVDRLQTAVPGTVVHLAVDEVSDLSTLADTQRFAQVLDNVLRNAAKYSPPKAPIDVAVIGLDGEVRISVHDAGDGIAAADVERIFDRYARGARHAATTPGAGIGLAIAREIVNEHGGRIWAESAGAGHGSTFVIALPAATVTSDRGTADSRS